MHLQQRLYGFSLSLFNLPIWHILHGGVDTMLWIGIFSALGLLLLALKIGGRKTIGNDIFVDVLITVTLMVCFYGTFSGMAAAMVGGLFASIILFVLKKTMRHEVLTVKNQPKKVFNKTIKTPSLQWEIVEPKWVKK